jgi:hypothetical protein
MPWSPKQHRLFCAAAHSSKVAKSSGIPQAKASEMCHEGVKKVAEAVVRKKMKKGW